MIFHSKFREFGALRVVEVYDYYDRPLMLTLKNELGHLFLAKLADIEDQVGIWLYLPISEERYLQFRSGGIDTYTVFKKPEIPSVYLVKISETSSEDFYACVSISPEDIPDDYLPVPGSFLEIDTMTVTQLEPVSVKVKQLNRVLLRLKLYFENIRRTEAPAKTLGELLINVQDILNSIGQALKENMAITGPFPQSIVTSNEMMVGAIGPGSFQIDLISSRLPNVLGESEVDIAIKEFVELIQIGNDSDRLQEKLRTLHLRVAGKYLSFLEKMSDQMIKTDVEWSTPMMEHSISASMTRKTAIDAATIIKRSVDSEITNIDMVGTLIGANLRNHEFEIENVNEEKITGKISDQALNRVEGAILGNVYGFTIRTTTSIKPLTGETGTRYELIKLDIPK